ncbi:MAG TPA: zf-HC2 domain-containing protein [Anaerolineales bacterium]|nr:zf-HC2 domain-containing protein [Anaerolineales bacterium]
MHLNDGEILAYRDGELSEAGKKRAEAHLADCAHCLERVQSQSVRAARLLAQLALLDPSPREAASPFQSARARLQTRLSTTPTLKENSNMFQKFFARPYRPAWGVVAVVLLLVAAMAFAPVRAIANSFLGLFRVQQFTIAQVNPGDLPEQLGASSQFEHLLAEDVQIEELGKPQEVASVAEASALVGFPVRLPTEVKGEIQLVVQPGMRATFQVDLNRMKSLLAEIGREDISLPAELDGATVVMELPASVSASFGDCEVDPAAARAAGQDPDDPTPQRPDCTTLVQMPSPSISAPPGLDVAKIGEAFLQLLGMSQAEAAHFSQQVDWTTTLVVPIPRYNATYADVIVDGVKGTHVQQSLKDHLPQYLLLWIKDGIVYALTGPGNSSTSLTIADSLK